MASETGRVPRDVERYVEYIRGGRPGPHAYAVLLGLRIYDTERLFRRVSEGFKIKTCEHFQRNFLLETETVAELLQTPRRTLARRKLEGSLRPRESDRLLSVTRVFARALDLFEGDRDAGLRWMESAQPGLAGQTPLEAIRTELGTVEVERLIDRLEQGVYA